MQNPTATTLVDVSQLESKVLAIGLGDEAMTDANKKIVQDYVATLNQGDWDLMQRLFAADAKIHGALGSGSLDVALTVWRELHSALSMNLTAEAMIGEGDLVAVRFIERGKSVAPFRGRPATQNGFEMPAIEWFRVTDGRIVERWGIRDSAAQARQLGWAP
jgi:steroid delta-isomerase-like uncharacterized protein